LVKENDKEEPEILTDWEKMVSKKLEKLDSLEKDVAEIKELVKAKPERVKPLKKTPIEKLIAQSTPFLEEFNPQKLVELAQAEGLVGNEKYSDDDIAKLNHAVGEPFVILDEMEREKAISLLCQKLGIDSKRFDIAKAQEKIILPVDAEWYDFEKKQPLAESSEIEVVEKTVQEETPQEASEE